MFLFNWDVGTSLVVQWLGTHLLNRGLSLILDQGAKIPCPTEQLSPRPTTSEPLFLGTTTKIPRATTKTQNRQISNNCFLKTWSITYLGPPWWFSHKEYACNAVDVGLIPGSGRSPGEGNGYPLQPRESQGEWSLAGGCKELDRT